MYEAVAIKALRLESSSTFELLALYKKKALPQPMKLQNKNLLRANDIHFA